MSQTAARVTCITSDPCGNALIRSAVTNPRVLSVSGSIGAKISESLTSSDRWKQRSAPAVTKEASGANGSQIATSAPIAAHQEAYRAPMLPAPITRTRLPRKVPLVNRASSPYCKPRCPGRPISGR